jgi:hypothetical protein
MPKYIEAVTVCVNYSDFLAHTLPHNKQFFDNYVVVTDTKDEKTKALCEHYKVTCIQTDAFYENEDKINKGKGINEGLKALKKIGWVVHLDADIYLPPLTRDIFENTPMDPKGLYGIDRMMCPTYEEWQEYLSDPDPIHQSWVYVHMTAFPVGVRIAQYYGEGYLPIGYFQMWNPKNSGIFEYPKEHGSVDRSDVIFAKMFYRSNRHLLPELVCIHLDSEDLNLKDMGKNWDGRKTAPFSQKKTVAVDHNQHDIKDSRTVQIGKKGRGYNRPSVWHRIKDLFKKKELPWVILAIELAVLLKIVKDL